MLRLRSGRVGPARYRRLPVDDDELERDGAVPLVRIGPVDRPYRRRKRVDMVEEDCGKAVRAGAGSLEDELQMLLADDPLLGNVEEVVEGRRGKPLAPDFARQRGARSSVSVGRARGRRPTPGSGRDAPA